MLNLDGFKNLFQNIWNEIQMTNVISSNNKNYNVLSTNSVDRVVIKIKVNSAYHDIRSSGSNSFDTKFNKKGGSSSKKVLSNAKEVSGVSEVIELKVFKVINQENRSWLVAEKNKILAMKQAVDHGFEDKLANLTSKDITKAYMTRENSQLPTKRGII